MDIEADGALQLAQMIKPGELSMPVVEIQIEAIECYAAGRSFSDAGSYL